MKHVVVVIANEYEKVKVCEVYDSPIGSENKKALKRFEELKKTYGGANVCFASREVLEG